MDYFKNVPYSPLKRFHSCFSAFCQQCRIWISKNQAKTKPHPEVNPVIQMFGQQWDESLLHSAANYFHKLTLTSCGLMTNCINYMSCSKVTLLKMMKYTHMKTHCNIWFWEILIRALLWQKNLFQLEKQGFSESGLDFVKESCRRM